MSITARYEAYKPLNNDKWELLLSSHTVNKEGGVLEQLEDIITTGPDARVAVILDTEKLRHVPIFRVNIAGQTKIKPLAGGWKNGDGGIVGNTNVEQIAGLAKELNEQLLEETDDQYVVVPDNDLPQEAEPVVDEEPASYEGQPDWVILNWMCGDYELRQYVIPTPTERQLRALNIAHGCFLNGTLTKRQEAALSRINVALAENADSCDMLVADIPQLAAWVGIWKDLAVKQEEGSLRIENSTVEVIVCGAYI